MSKAFQSRLPVEARQKIYLLLAFVSLILLFYSIWQIKPVIVEVEDPVGLVSHFTACYWIGLALLVLDAIFAFLDRELKKDAIFIVILITLGMFLFGIVPFVYENTRHADVYYHPSLVYNLLEEHHIDIKNSPLATYYQWPALLFTSASILTTTGFTGDFIQGLVKYVPLFYMLCFVFITYSIGKRLELAPNYCFLLSFLTLSSWLYMFHYANHAVALLLYLLIFMLLISPRRTVAESVIIMLLYGALVITHGLTSLAVLPALVTISIYRKEGRFIALFVAIFAAWFLYQATPAMEAGVRWWWANPLFNIFEMAQVERYATPSAPARLVIRYSTLTYVALYGSLVVGSAILLLRRSITGQRRKQVIFLFCWAIGAGVIIFSGYGQALWRSYIFCIVPAVAIVVLSFPSRKLMLALMCLCVALSLPANYGGEVSWGQVLTTELKGAKFFACEVKPQPPDEYFYVIGGGERVILSYNPNLLGVHRRWAAQFPSEVDLSTLDRVHYVIISKQGTDGVKFAWGEDPYAAWPETEAGKRANLIYNNGYFQIYENHLDK